MKNYHVIRNVLTPQTIRLIKFANVILKNNQYFLNNVPIEDKSYFADKQPVSHDCWGIYGTPISESLMLEIQPLVERLFEVKLHPTYSFTRFYWTGAEMASHVDRPACEYSVSICIDVNPSPWGIWFDKEELFLKPGDMVAYKGCEVPHWREPYKGQEQLQIFLHYVDQNGPYADQIFDKRPMLGL